MSPGQVVKGQVVLVDDKGVLVSLAKNLNAFVPNEHLSDLGAKQGKAKHRLGATVTGRILTADPARQRMTMTLKQALVSSKLKPLAAWEVRDCPTVHLWCQPMQGHRDIGSAHDASNPTPEPKPLTHVSPGCQGTRHWLCPLVCRKRTSKADAEGMRMAPCKTTLTSVLCIFTLTCTISMIEKHGEGPLVQDAEVGMRALGTVVGLADYGVFVRFYGDMKGLVHISELGLEPGTQPAAAFKIGQVRPAATTAFRQPPMHEQVPADRRKTASFQVAPRLLRPSTRSLQTAHANAAQVGACGISSTGVTGA